MANHRQPCRQPLSLPVALLAVTIAGALDLNAALGQASPMPRELLEEYGLTRLDRVWVLSEEIDLKRDFAELPKRREQILATEKSLNERIEQNRVLWQQSRAPVAALKQALGKLATGDPQRPALQRQIDGLEAAACEPGKLAAKGDVCSQVVHWTAERNELAAATHRIRRALPKLVDRYADLAKDELVQRALRQAGERHRLGPQRNYEGDLQKLGEYERLVFTLWNPIHWQAGYVRVTGLVDERSAITFSWIEESHQPTLITTTAAEGAGLAVPDDAPTETIVLNSGRSVTARQIAIPYLRFGACMLRDVTSLVLPPEAEDWGSRIGREAFTEHSVRIEPERLRLWIDGPNP